jgi:hypothetical protein
MVALGDLRQLTALARREQVAGMVRHVAGSIRRGAAQPGRIDESLLPVAPAFERLLPQPGLRRGSTVAAAGSTSLALALAAEASRAGSWCVAVGFESLGFLAAAEMGLALERFPLVVDREGDRNGSQWVRATAALLDAFDLVLASPPPRLGAGAADRLSLRARERGAVLVVREGWPARVDLTLSATGGRWVGVGRGWGHLRARLVEVTVTGRGAAALARRATLWLPDHHGGVARADTEATTQATPPASTAEVAG